MDNNTRLQNLKEKHHSAAAWLEKMSISRQDEIIDKLLEADTHYLELTKKRAKTSQAVLDVLIEHGKTDCFESYSDAIYAKEVYEMDIVYLEAFLDAFDMV